MSRYLLETTTCSRLMENEPTVKRHLESLTDLDYSFTIPIVHGEILYGIERLPTGKRKRDISQRANRLFSEIQCDPIPKETAAENDLWIAATALALDAILVTSDTDFQRIQGLLGLQLEDWTT